MLSRRDRVSSTGRPVIRVSSAAWAWTFRSSFAPKAPPLLTCVTRTFSTGSARKAATCRRPQPPVRALNQGGRRPRGGPARRRHHREDVADVIRRLPLGDELPPVFRDPPLFLLSGGGPPAGG